MKVSANVIMGDVNDEIYAPFALRSVENFVDEYVVVNSGSKYNPNLNYINDFIETTAVPVRLIHEPFVNFATVRDTALKNSSCEWILKTDLDEVHTKELLDLKMFLDMPKVSRIQMHFYHFVIDYDHFEGVMSKSDYLFKKGENTRYEGDVHEQLEGVPKGITLNSGYQFFHYGYCKQQKEVFKRWEQYAKLEGETTKNAKLLEECGGPDTILEHRRERLKEFKGQHPLAIRQWISNQKLEERSG